MSEDKKTIWGKAGETTPSREPKDGAGPSPGTAPSQPTAHKSNAPAKGGENDADHPSRARNQSVLPEILGKQLRAAYGELLNTPVPDSITDLIKRLESTQAGKPAGKPRKEEGK